MIELKKAIADDLNIIMAIIGAGKKHLKEQGIDQWQDGYPDETDIQSDIEAERGFLAVENEKIFGYLCIDFNGEPAYNDLEGQWNTDENYVVVHRLAFSEEARGKGLTDKIFALVEEMSKGKGVYSFRADTDEGNKKMQHIFKKNGFEYRGKIRYVGTEKIAFDKIIK